MPDDKNLRYRYPGTKPFEADEHELFKGRDDDVQGLSELIALNNLVVLFGRSGLGKSSLLNAGLVNRFGSGSGTAPLFVRFGAYYGENTASPLAKLHDALTAHTEAENASNFIYEKLLPKEAVAPHNLWYLFKSHQLAHPRQQSIVLIFDQFEEAFTYPDADVEAFKKELSELLFVSVPQQLRNILKEELRLNPAYLTEEEKECLFRPLNVKALFSIRSDKLSLLNNFTDCFPSVLNTCYELKPLSKEQARKAVEIPAGLEGKQYASAAFTFTAEAVDLLLKGLTEEKAAKDKTSGGQDIETFQLQIVCRHAENKVMEKGLRQITAADLGDIKAIFENHYRNILGKFSPAQRQPAQRLIEEKLIIDGNRVSMPVPFVLRDEGMTPELLEELINTHLLRREQANTVEISHDTLVEPILKQYEERRKEEAVAAELREKEAQIKTLKEQQRQEAQHQKARRNKLLVSIVSVALVLAIGLAAFAFKNLRLANEQKIVALRHKQIADSVAKMAITDREKADSAAEVARFERKRADSLTAVAVAEKRKANNNASFAQEQQKIAEAQKTRAEEYARVVAAAKAEVDSQKKEIETIKEAYRLTVLSYEWIDKDPTVALRIQEAAMQKFNDTIIGNVAQKIFEKHAFYQTLVDGLPESLMAVSTDGSSFVTNSGLWDVSGRKRWSFKESGRGIEAVAFTPDGTTIVTGSQDGVVRVWDAEGTLRYRFSGNREPVTAVAIAPKGNKIFGNYGHTESFVWEIDSTVVWRKVSEGSRYFRFAAFSPDGKNLLVGPKNDTAYLWNIDKDTLVGRFAGMTSISNPIFSPDGKAILTREGSWDVEKKKPIWKFDYAKAGFISHHALSPDGNRTVTVSSDGEIRLWQTDDGKLLHQIKGTPTINSVGFTSDGKNILTGSVDTTIKLWGLYNTPPTKAFEIQKRQEEVKLIAISAAGTNFLTISGDTIVKIWDSTGRLERELPVHKDTATAIALSPTGDAVFTGSSSGVGRWWDKNGLLRKEWLIEESKNSLTAASFSFDGRKILTASEGRVRLLNTNTGRTIDLGTLDGYSAITCLALSPDENTVLIGTGGRGRQMRDGRILLRRLGGNNSKNIDIGAGSLIAFSPNGEKFITGRRLAGTISEYTTQGKFLRDFYAGHALAAIGFAKDGSRVLAGSFNGEISVWDSAMTLQEFLQSNKLDKLTPAQKKQFGIQ